MNDFKRADRLLLYALLLIPVPLHATTATDICGSPLPNPCIITTVKPITDGSVIDLGSRALEIANGGALQVGSGSMTIMAGALTVDSGGAIRALGNNSAIKGGTITLDVVSASIAPPLAGSSTAAIDASGSGGGTIEIDATGAVAVAGPIPTPGVAAIAARSLANDHDGGTITIKAAAATIAGLVSVLGGATPNGSAGTIIITTAGDVTVSGTLDARGGDTGVDSVDITTTAGGNVTLTSSSVLTADALASGGSAGGFTIITQGSNATMGLLTASGLISAVGAPMGLNGGGDGGDVCIETVGDITIDQTAAIHEDAAPGGFGGSLGLMSDMGAVNVLGLLSDMGPGPNSIGGDGCIDANTDILISGMVLFTGGGTIDICSNLGSVTLQDSGVVDVTGDCGTICMNSGTDPTASVLVEGKLIADGIAGTNAGEIDLEGTDSVRVTASGSLHASAANASGGEGGLFTVQADNGNASIEGPLTARGAGPSGMGGDVTIKGLAGVSITAPIDAKSPGAGRTVTVSSDGGSISVSSTVDISSSNAAGGSISINGNDDVSISATLTADGNALPGGHIAIDGCDVTLCGPGAANCTAGNVGVLSSLGIAGTNTVTGRISSAIFGTMLAGNANTLIWSGANTATPPEVVGHTDPLAVVTVDSSISCTSCIEAGACTPIPTPTATPTPTPTSTASATPVNTPISTATVTHVATATRTPTSAVSPATPSATSKPTPTPTGKPVSCVGDCDGSGMVTVNELVILVNIDLGYLDVSACPDGIPPGTPVNIALLIQAVNNLLLGCGG